MADGIYENALREGKVKPERKSSMSKAKRQAIKDFGIAAAASSDPAAMGRQFAKDAIKRAHRKALKKTSANKRGVNQV